MFLCSVSISGPTPRLLISLLYNSYFMFTDLIFRRWLYSGCFFCPGNLNYAYCRNTRTLAGDLAGTYYVLFLTKIQSYIIWKEFWNCSNDKYLILSSREEVVVEDEALWSLGRLGFIEKYIFKWKNH